MRKSKKKLLDLIGELKEEVESLKRKQDNLLSKHKDLEKACPNGCTGQVYIPYKNSYIGMWENKPVRLKHVGSFAICGKCGYKEKFEDTPDYEISDMKRDLADLKKKSEKRGKKKGNKK